MPLMGFKGYGELRRWGDGEDGEMGKGCCVGDEGLLVGLVVDLMCAYVREEE